MKDRTQQFSNKRVIKILIAVLAFAFILVAGFAVYFSGLLEKEPKVETQPLNCFQETLTVAADEDYWPYVFHDESGKLSGHDIELINVAANRLEMNLDLIATSWEESLALAKAGKVDAVLTCEYGDSEAMGGYLIMTTPIDSEKFVVFGKEKIDRLDEAIGKRIALMVNGNAINAIRAQGMQKWCVEYESNKAAFEALAADECDYVIVRYDIGRGILKEMGTRAKGIEPYVYLAASNMCIGVSASKPELAERINALTIEMRKDGTVKKLNDKWLTDFLEDTSFESLIKKHPGVFSLVIAFLLALVVGAVALLLEVRHQKERVNEQVRREMEAAALKERDEAEAHLREQMARVMELSDDFQAIYDVDMETGKYEIFSYDNGYADSVLKSNENGTNFYSDTLKDVRRVVYHEDQDLVIDTFSNKDYIKKKLAARGEFTIDYRLLREGQPAWYRVRVVKKAGEDDHFLVGIFNVDERVRKEAEYQKNIEEGLKVIGGLANDCISLYTVKLEDNSYNVYSITDEVNDIKTVVEGYSDLSSSLRQYADGYVHEEDRDKIYYFADLNNMRKALRKTRSHKVMVRRKMGGDWVWIEMNMIKCEPVSEPAKNVILAFTNRDSQVKQDFEVRQQLENALSMAQNASRAKTAFLNNMSHDIRTPMNAIIGYTTMAKKYSENPRVNEYLNKIDISGKQLLSLVNQVLEMSRIESGKVNITEEPVDILELAKGLETVLSAEMAVKGIAYTFNTEKIKHRQVLTDISRINQIVVNIVGNAVKYTPEGGHIDCTIEERPCEKEGYGLYVTTIADTGIGMSEEFLEHLFEEFTRENSSTVSIIQGTGLGMSIVKKLIDLMDSTIDVHSKLGEGTTVTISVPMKWNTDTVESVTDVKKAKEISLKGMRILLVEDNEMNREIATEILEEEGIIVETAEDGDIAVEMLKQIAEVREWGYYNAVLMDIQMPRMNGYEATRIIRGIASPEGVRMPIIALSANAFEEDRQKSIEAGMDDHVAKPIDIQKLKETLVKYL